MTPTEKTLDLKFPLRAESHVIWHKNGPLGRLEKALYAPSTGAEIAAELVRLANIAHEAERRFAELEQKINIARLHLQDAHDLLTNLQPTIANTIPQDLRPFIDSKVTPAMARIETVLNSLPTSKS